MTILAEEIDGKVKIYYDDNEGKDEMEPYTTFRLDDKVHTSVDYDAMALILLHKNVIFVGAMLISEKTPCVLQVNCNDTFAYACADSEPLTLGGIESLYTMWIQEPKWASMKWCCLQRKQKPLQYWIDAMKKDNAWTDELESL